MSKNNGNSDKKSFWSNEFISIILIPIISGIIGIILNFFGEICPWYYQIIGLGISLVFIIIFYVLGYSMLIPRINKYIEKKTKQICDEAIAESYLSISNNTAEIVSKGIAKYENTSSMLEELSGKYFTLQQMIEMEQSGQLGGCSIVQIDAITSTLKYEVPQTDELSAEDSFSAAIIKNISRGIKYNYYYPATPKNGDYKHQIIQAYKPFVADDSIGFFEISAADSDFLVEDFDFTLYTVDDHGKQKKYCLMGIGTYLGDKQEPVMILVGQYMVDRLISIYSKYNDNI